MSVFPQCHVLQVSLTPGLLCSLKAPPGRRRELCSQGKWRRLARGGRRPPLSCILSPPLFLRPMLIDMNKVYRQANVANLEQAFSVAEHDLGVTRLLDPEGARA